MGKKRKTRKRRARKMGKTVSDIAAALEACATVLISVHRNPDGDALGSQLALMLALEKLGKRVSAHNLDPVPEIYRFLPNSGRITIGKEVNGAFDGMVVLDANPARTELFNGDYPAGVLINIDHHVTNPLEWPLTWLDINASATGEMVYQLIRQMRVVVDRDIALCLYTAIFTDTGSFRYSNTTAESMKIAATLLEAGADPWLVTENVYESFAFRRLKLLGHVLAGMERSRDGRIVWVVVTDELYQMTGTTSEDTENFVNFVRSVKGVEVAVLFRQTGSRQYKVSLRSKGRVDLSGLAQSLGGGGHKNAAGCVLDGTIEEVRRRVVTEVQAVIQEQMGTPSSD
jgi:phosphoesterase RecJ-like protein